MAEQATQQDTQTGPDDWLGYDRYARTLWSRMQLALPQAAGPKGKPPSHHALPTADPLVVGVYGEWGAGKTRLLELVHRLVHDEAMWQLAQRSLDPDAFDKELSLTLPVWFHPWKYEHEPALAVPLLMHLADAIKTYLKDGRTFTEAATQAVVANAKTAAELAEKVQKGVSVLQSGLEVTHKVCSHKLTHIVAGTVGGLFGMGEVARGAVQMAGRTAGKMVGKDDEPDESDEDDADAGGDDDASADGKAAAKKGKPKASKAAATQGAPTPRFSADGSYYYNVHRFLRELSHITPKSVEAFDPKLKLKSDVRLNFVVFVDDLDRCLPEKAVEVLEIIKTVLNVESFAFMVALDDEVIERGIAHRYKDYRFQGMKPEMPITGFEYLEKIIHLPFRLPQLTRAQAQTFLLRHEERLMADPGLPVGWQRLWFAPADHSTVEGLASTIGGDAADPPRNATVQLGPSDLPTAPALQPTALTELLLDSFEAHVPRKMARAQELLHQLQQVLVGRGLSMALYPAGARRMHDHTSAPDATLLLHFALLQLFAPELFRLLRRRPEAWREWMQAHLALEPSTHEPVFSPSRRQAPPHFVLQASDALLFRWVARGAKAARTIAPEEQAPSASGLPALDEWSGDLSGWRAQMARYLGTDAAALHSAEQVRLPLVMALCAYRDTQRHAFNPLHCAAALVATQGWITSDQIEPPTRYLQLFAGQVAPPSVMLETGPASAHVDIAVPLAPAARYEISLGLLRELVGSGDASARASLIERLGLQPGDLLPPAAISEVAAAAQSLPPEHQLALWAQLAPHLRREELLAADPAPALRSAVPWPLLNAGIAEPIAARLSVLRKHDLLGPLDLTREADALRQQLAKWRVDPSAHNLDRARAADALAPLGDERFGFYAKRWYLPSVKHGNGVYEPIVGFVHVPEVAEFARGEVGGADNLLEKIAVPAFCMARTLTTVAQWEAFEQDGGYTTEGWWGPQGREWLGGGPDRHNLTDTSYQQHLARRPLNLRRQPWRWDEQRAFGQRPVWGITWFEARAYACWLTEKLKPEMERAGLKGWQVRLPTEDQWERAARAASATSVDSRRWPWGVDATAAAFQANVDAAKLGQVSPVGLFPHNPLGLFDLAGNLWEWQDNLYTTHAPKGLLHAQVLDDAELRTDKDREKNDQPALRGGSWMRAAASARCAFRSRGLPDYFDRDVGLRVVLSEVRPRFETRAALRPLESVRRLSPGGVGRALSGRDRSL